MRNPSMDFPLFTILIIDDNPENRGNLRKVIAQLPECRVIEVESGTAALAQISQQPVHLIFLCVDISGMDGFEITRRLSVMDQARNIPIIFMSKISSAEFIHRGYQIGVVDYLTIPIDDNLLRNRVQSYRALFDREQLISQSLSQLKVSEQRLTYALEATEEGLWDWYIPTDEVYFSPPFEQILGVSPGTLEPKLSALFDRLLPDDRECVTSAYQRLASGAQERLELEYQVRTEAKNWIWLLVRGKVVEYEWRRSYNPTGEKIVTRIPIRVVGTISDISVRIAADQELRRAAAVIEHMSDALAILNPNETILNVNPAFTRATGYKANELLGRPIGFLKSGRHNTAFFQAIRRALHENGSWKGEIWNRRANGECYPEWLNISVLRDEHGEIKHYICIYSDLSTQDHVRQRLHDLAYYDTLTGLANHEMFHDRLASALATAKREGHLVAVLLLDLDKFKEINENLGHNAGDEVLIEVGTRLKDCIQTGDTVARISGDEFAILLPYVHDTNSIAHLADQIHEKIRTPFHISDQPIYLSASIGISLYPQDGLSLEELLRSADLALYHAKEEGRNKYQFCSAKLTEVAQENFRMTANLRRALERQEFILYFQPLINMAQNVLSGAEVLVRWQPPTGPIIPPGHFLPVAEKAGLMADLDTLILTSACQQVRNWQDQGFMLPRIAVNLSGSVLERMDLTNSITQVLRETQLPAQCLELEISEGFIMARAEYAVSALDYLRHMGISLAIDDFGTGYSSLSYLKRLPIDHLKIDQSFVKDLPTDAHDASIARAIIALGKSLDLRIIAEGIETEEQRDFLRSEGCDEGQGYFLGRPMPADKFRAWAEQYQKQHTSSIY